MELGRLSRLQLYGIVSSTCFVWAIVNAFRVRSNFYSAAVYLSKSNACMMVRLTRCTAGNAGQTTHLRRHAEPRELTTSDSGAQILWNQGIYQTVLFGKLMQAIFFGELRMIEVEVRFQLRREARRRMLRVADLSPFHYTALARARMVRRYRDSTRPHHLQGRVRVVVCLALRQLALPQGVPLAGLGPSRDGKWWYTKLSCKAAN